MAGSHEVDFAQIFSDTDKATAPAHTTEAPPISPRQILSAEVTWLHDCATSVGALGYITPDGEYIEADSSIENIERTHDLDMATRPVEQTFIDKEGNERKVEVRVQRRRFDGPRPNMSSQPYYGDYAIIAKDTTSGKQSTLFSFPASGFGGASGEVRTWKGNPADDSEVTAARTLVQHISSSLGVKPHPLSPRSQT